MSNHLNFSRSRGPAVGDQFAPSTVWLQNNSPIVLYEFNSNNKKKKCLKSFVRSCTQHLRLAGHRTCHYKFLVKCRQCDIRSDQSATNPVFYRRTAAFLSLITQQITKAIVANKENWIFNRVNREKSLQTKAWFPYNCKRPRQFPSIIWGTIPAILSIFFYGNTLFRRLGQSTTHSLRPAAEGLNWVQLFRHLRRPRQREHF